MVPRPDREEGKASVEAPPHDKPALRRAVALEAAALDNAVMTIRALATDDRAVAARMAGPAALLVAELHKLGEQQETPVARCLTSNGRPTSPIAPCAATQNKAPQVSACLCPRLDGAGYQKRRSTSTAVEIPKGRQTSGQAPVNRPGITDQDAEAQQYPPTPCD
jgi:hypothetical protein